MARSSFDCPTYFQLPQDLKLETKVVFVSHLKETVLYGKLKCLRSSMVCRACFVGFKSGFKTLVGKPVKQLWDLKSMHT